MAGSTYQVKAVFSAETNRFKSGVKAVTSSLSNLSGTLMGGIGFGALASIGSSAMTGISNSVRGLIGEISETNKAWKSFESNMKLSGMASSEIKSVQSDLQDFAAKTIYSSSDMASTFAQLYAVNNKTTTALVKGFGAVAASAENPTQAMKTLSTQATQMAAKPTVAWEDFKLVLEQTPAGISQIAKAMGKTSKELVADVQAGTVSTEDFFAAIEKCGNNKALMNMATQYKSVGEAAEGLTATVAQGLTPAFDALSQGGISIIVSLMGKLSARFDALNKAFAGVGTEFVKAINAILTELGVLEGDGGLESFTASAESAAKTAKKFAKYLQENAKKVAGLIQKLPQLASSLAAIAIGIKVGKKLLPLAETLTSVGANAVATSKKVRTSAKRMLSVGKSFALVGAGALMIGAGFFLIATAAENVAEAGPLAVGVLAGMVAVVGALLAVCIMFGKQLNTAAVGMISFGATVLMITAGFSMLLLAVSLVVTAVTGLINAFTGLVNSLTLFVQQLPMIAAYGAPAAMSLMLLAAAILMVGASAIASGALVLAGGAMILAGAALVVAAGAMFTIASIGVAALGVGATVAAVGVGLLAAAMKLTETSLSGIVSKAASAGESISQMLSAVDILKTGISGLSSIVSSAFGKFVSSLKSKLKSAKGAAKSGMNGIISAFKSGASKARSAGAQIGQGLANGLASKYGTVSAQAEKLVAAANKAITAAAKIHSPSKVTTGYGAYIGQGLANGIASKVHEVRSAAADLFQPFNRPALAFETGFHSAMTYSEEMNWSANRVYNITVVSELDGREIARTTAPYTEAELNKRQRRDERKKGRR